MSRVESSRVKSGTSVCAAMSGNVSVTAVLGVGSSSPHCYVLRVDEWSLLLDCGWNAAMDESLFTPAACALLASVDCVLLSHSTLRHCGALPYVHRRLALGCPVYATLPVCRMGAMTLYDHYQQHVSGITAADSRQRYRTHSQSQPQSQQPPSEAMEPEDELFSLDDIDAVFDSMQLLKYSEERPLSDKLAAASSATRHDPSDIRAASASAASSSTRIVISPHASGHSVGGCVWRIVCEGAVLMYAVDYNHSHERHLEGGLLEAFTRPSLLIMDCGSLSPPPALPTAAMSSSRPQATGATTRKARESRLLDLVLGCVNGGGVCLLPVDSAGRVLELLALLHLTWEASRMYEGVPLLFASPQSGTTVEFVQQQVEWLSDAMQNHFNSERTNPFHLPHVHTVTDIQQVDSITQHCTKPAVILATSHTLQPNSIALAVMERIAQQPNSLVLLTQDIEHGTVAHDLFTRAVQAGGAPFSLPVYKPSRVALEGDELRQYLLRAKVREEQRLMENSQQTAMDEQQSDGDDEDDEDEDDSQTAVAAHQRSAKQQPALSAFNGHSALQPVPQATPALLSAPPSASSVSSQSLSASSFPAFYQFPFSEPRRQSDQFGEMIDHSAPSQPLQQPHAALSADASSSFLPSTQQPPSSSHTTRPTLGSLPQSANRPALNQSTSSASSSSSPSSSHAASPPSLSPVVSGPAAASKCVWQWSAVSVLCHVSYVDFRGVSDLRSWKNIVSRVKPRKLVLVRGTEDDKKAFGQFCDDRRICTPAASVANAAIAATATVAASGAEDTVSVDDVNGKASMQQEVASASSTAGATMEVDSTADGLDASSRMPPVSHPASQSSLSSSGVLIASVMSAVDISSELSYRFGMAPSLLSRLRFARVADYEVAHTSAVVLQSESALPQLVAVTGLPPSTATPIPLSTASTATASSLSASGGASVFLGDYRFADFRRVLALAGIDSEFYVKGGVLVAAGGSVRIRKSSPNTLTVQGVASEQFYAVRQLLYTQYSAVTPYGD